MSTAEAKQYVAKDLEKPLTDWKNEPTVRDLKQDFLDAKSSHDSQVTKISTWLNNLNVEGAAKPKVNKGSSRIQPKLIRKQAEWRYAALSEPFLSTDDLFTVNPVTWEDKAGAHQNELVLNNQFNTRIDKVKFVDEYVRTLVDEGTAIVRIGWQFEEEEQEVEYPVIEFLPAESQEEMEMLQLISSGQLEEPPEEEWIQAVQLSQESGMPLVPRQTGVEVVKEMVTVKNQPTVEICDYRNVIVDPTCNGDIRKAGFVIYSFETSMSQLKRDGIYKNLDKVNISSNSILGQPDHNSSDDSSFNFSDEPRKKFVAYEYWGYWDIDGTGKVEPIVATWVGDVLIRMDRNPFPDQLIPFISVQYLPVRKSIYGEPDGALLEDNQRIIGAVTRGMIDIMGKSANGQTGIRKDALDITNRRKFENGLDYEFNVNVDPRQAIFMHTYPEIPNSAQVMLGIQNAEAESLSGVKAFHSGLTGNSLGDTATGIRGALDAASKREVGILRRLADGIIQIGRKFVSMNAEFMSESEVVRITNEEFVEIRREELPGEYDLKLTISTAEEDNQKAQELAFMLQTMGNSMPPEMSQMVLADIARLRKMPTLAKKIEVYQPQPDPIEQERRQLENELLKAQIARESALAQYQGSNAGLSQAKTQTEMAKAENISADTDLKTLDFVEEESGVKQERALQMAGEQAKANAKLEMVKAALNSNPKT